MPYLEALLIKDLGWDNVIAAAAGEWTGTELDQDRNWWMWKREKKDRKGGRLDVLRNLLWGHPEWNLSGPVCQITSSFSGLVSGFDATNKLNSNTLFCTLASLTHVTWNIVNYERRRCFLPVQHFLASFFGGFFWRVILFFTPTAAKVKADFLLFGPALLMSVAPSPHPWSYFSPALPWQSQQPISVAWEGSL